MIASACVGGLATAAAVVLDGPFQVVDGVQEHVLAARRRRRRCRAAPPGRAAASAGAGAAASAAATCGALQDRVAAGGGGDHDVGFGQMPVQFRQRQRHAAVARGQFLRVGQGAVGDQQPLARCACTRWRAASSMVSPAPISSTVESLEAGEGLLRQPHRGGGDRHRVGADAGVGARALGGGEGLLEQAVERPPSVPASRAVAQASFTWPRICGSPSTSESSPVATRNRWRTASASRWRYR